MGEHEKMRNTGIKECAHRLNTDVRPKALPLETANF